MPNNYRTPINRNNMFYSEDDFQLEMDILEGYFEEDVNQRIVLYRVDRSKTQMNDIYNESKQEISFLPPIEIPCLYEIQDNKIETYDKKTNRGVFAIHGNLKVYITLKSFEKYDFDIKRGDYIGIMIEEGRMYYWSVVNDGKINISNQMHIGAYKPGFRVIDAAPVNDEFKGI
jgi:hypothetical protein